LPEIKSPAFQANVNQAMGDAQLQQALAKLKGGFQVNRVTAAGKLPEFETLRDQATGIKEHTLAHLDFYLEAFEEKTRAAGGQVHWACTAADARRIILELCRQGGAGKVIKGKSMITEEIGLNDFLIHNGLEVVETDLGEYIIQLRNEPPSHIIAPAIHVSKEQVADDFREAHEALDPQRPLAEPRQLLDEARHILREHFLSADVGITGANFLVAETGSVVIVTNEGNGDLTQTLSKMHVVVASLEKVVPTLEDSATLLRLLARSATGQELSVYTTYATGPKREQDPDGPGSFHVVLLNGGRTDLLGGPLNDVLRCIRCGACMNSCPVYGAIGGHAYGWVYPGPIGAVLTPALIGMEKSHHLPHASSFCGKCEEVCPVRIPLPKMMRHLREKSYEKGALPRTFLAGMGFWAFLARRPRLYRTAANFLARALAWAAMGRGALKHVPFAAGWTSERDLPAPEGRSFFAQYRKQKKGEKP